MDDGVLVLVVRITSACRLKLVNPVNQSLKLLLDRRNPLNTLLNLLTNLGPVVLEVAS